MTQEQYLTDWWINCRTCEKRAYGSRAAARRAVKRLHPGEHKQPYRCPISEWWHIGKLDGRVARGEIAKEHRYGEKVA